MATEFYAKDLITYDPLSETTRKERTALLGLSMLGVALVKVPLVPEKFSALGIDFSKINQTTFVRLYALVVGYYLVAFLVYGLTDYIPWRRNEVIQRSAYEWGQKQRQAEADKEAKHAVYPVDQKSYVKKVIGGGAYQGGSSYHLGHAASRIRAAFEFVLPLLFAAFTLQLLVTYVPKP